MRFHIDIGQCSLFIGGCGYQVLIYVQIMTSQNAHSQNCNDSFKFTSDVPAFYFGGISYLGAQQ